MPLIFPLTIAFISGISLSSLISPDICRDICSTLTFALFILLLVRRKFNRFQFEIYAVVLAFALSLLPMEFAENRSLEITDTYIGSCTFYGRITDITPSDEENTLRVTVDVEKIKNSSTSGTLPGKIYVYAPDNMFHNAEPGCEAIITGELTVPESAMNFGGFNLKRYYLSLGITGICNSPTSVKVFPASVHPSLIIYKIREFSKTTLDHHLSPENFEFVSAVLLGDRSGFSEKLTENARKIGISHVTAVSGMHVSILITLIFNATKLFTKRRKTKARIIFAVLVFYMILSGLSPSVIRASVMGCCCMSGIVTGRRTSSVLLILLCASVMLGMNPCLLYNPSFMLSFISTAGLIVFLPLLQARLKVTSPLVSTFLMTLVANVVTLPYLMWNFDYYSWLGLFSNLLIVPLISPIFIGGFLTVILSPLAPLSFVAGAVTNGLCSVVLNITLTLANLPFGQIPFRATAFITVVATYGFIFMVLFILRRNHRFTAVCFGVIVSLLLSFALYGIVQKQSFTVTHLYVGQGDSAVIQLPGGKIFLLDTGDVTSSGHSYSLEYLERNGIKEVYGVILSHEDSDHAGALDLIADRVNVKNIYVSANSLKSRDMTHIIKTAKQHGCNLVDVNSGDLATADEATFRFFCLGGTGTDTNRGSLVTSISCRGREFLFTGDIDTTAEYSLLPLLNKCDVLKVAHHGSAGSTSEPFLRKVTPEYAVISSGRYNSYSHPHSATVNRLIKNRTKTFVTANCGAVRFRVYRNGKITSKTGLNHH